MTDNSQESTRTSALKALDELHESAKLQIDRLIKKDREEAEKIQVLVEEERNRADKFKKLYEQERANIKILQGRVAELNHLKKLNGKSGKSNSESSLKGENGFAFGALSLEYTALYETVWPDAFVYVSTLKKNDEKTSVTYLYNVMKNCFQLCADVSFQQLNTLTVALSKPVALPSTNSKVLRHVGLPATKAAAITDIRELCAEESLDSIMESAGKKWPDYFKEPSLRHLTERVLEACWRIQLQHPAVYMDCGPKKGDKFDTDKYRSYKHAGSKIDFVIFPPLYVCRGGDLFAHGLAEGCDN